jgi:hypothetical protein
MRLTALPNTTAIRLALHCIKSDKGIGEELISTGAYAAFVAGCSSSDVQLKASVAGYYLIPSTFNPGTEASFEITLISDGPIDLQEVT